MAADDVDCPAQRYVGGKVLVRTDQVGSDRFVRGRGGVSPAILCTVNVNNLARSVHRRREVGPVTHPLCAGVEINRGTTAWCGDPAEPHDVKETR